MNVKASRFVRIGLALFAGLLCALAVCALPHEAQAVEKIGNGVYLFMPQSQASYTDTYKKADVTGDKKKDTVQFSDDPKNPKCVLKVNGKTVKTWKQSEYIVDVSIVTLSNKKSFLEIYFVKDLNSSKESRTHKLYQVKGGKLKSVCDLQKLVDAKTLMKYCGGADVVKVKKNTIYLKVFLNTKALGYVRSAGSLYESESPSYLQLAYSGGKFKMKSTAAKVSAEPGTFTAAKKIKTTKSVGSKKAGVTIAKGKKFSLKKMVVKDKKLYVQVKAKKGGKTGWVQLGKTKLVKQRAL